jgi:hypothetical protein
LIGHGPYTVCIGPKTDFRAALNGSPLEARRVPMKGHGDGRAFLRCLAAGATALG